MRIEGIMAGTHQITLDDIVPNCSINGLPSRTFSVSVGTTTRDTVRVGYEVHCVRAQKIAFAQENRIAHAYADGSNAVSLAFGHNPAWSPNDDIVAFEALACAGAYSEPPGPPPCARDGLATIRQDGAFRTRLTTDALDRDPAWSPAGDVIAFERGGLLYVIRPTGADLTQLIVPVMSARQPAWSPDGLQVAFTCTIDPSNTDICVVGRDGSGLRRLTTDAATDSEPAWSPDGTRIAFTTMRFVNRDEVALVSAAGGVVTRVIQGRSPTWSADGAKILFAITGLGLGTVNPDGSGFTVLTRQGEYAPAWRP
jgi:Tol biopolymer transport system component